MSHKKKRGGGHKEEHPDERWMASYMDMVTVLMCLFIVLYAMSSVDQTKFQKLAFALATGFGTTPSETVDTAEGVVVPPELVGKKGNLTDLQQAVSEVDVMAALQKKIKQGLAEKGLKNRVEFQIDERGLIVKLIGSSAYFGGNSADLTPGARRVLGAISPVLRTLPNEISIEGHADKHGSSAPFATDWELSSARATTVLRYFVESGAVKGKRIAAVGYGSARPATTVDNPAAWARNRRVEIVIISDKSDAIRALIPDVVAQEKAGKTPAEVTNPTGTTDTGHSDTTGTGGTAGGH